MPDWKVNCCTSATNTILCATSYCGFELLEKRNNTSVLNFSTTNPRIDSTNSTSVNAYACPLGHITANSHVATENTRKTIIAIDQNTTSKLTERSANTCHNRCWYIDFEFTNCVIIFFDICNPVFLWVVCKQSCSNHHVHKLRCFKYITITSILH